MENEDNAKKATVYGKTGCSFCVRAKALLENSKYDVEYVMLDDDEARQKFYDRMTAEASGAPVMSVPQIFVDNKYIGGYTEVVRFLNSNKDKERVAFNTEF